MTISLLLLASLQVSMSLEARSRKRGGARELTITGRGPALDGRESAELRFHRIVNRADAKTGALRTIALNEPWVRSAPVRDGRFEHVERFDAPGSVLVRLSVEESEVEARFRIGSTADLVAALGRDAKETARAIEETRGLLASAQPFLDRCASKPEGLRLVRRIEHRWRSLRAIEARTPLSASTALLMALLTDLRRTLEVSLSGKRGAKTISSLTGRPFNLDDARRLVTSAADTLRRERSMVLARETAVVLEEIPRAVRRAKRRMTRDLDVLAQTAAGGPLAPLVEETRRLFRLARAQEVCPEIGAGDVERLRRSLAERAEKLGAGFRGGFPTK